MSRNPTAARRWSWSPPNIITGGLVLSLALLLFSLCVGRYPLSWSQLMGIITGGADTGAQRIFWYVRLPRALLVLVAGGGLALAGTVLQGIMQNPLISPDIIGVSAGASLGAAVAIVMMGADPKTIQLLAFVGGITATLTAYFLSRATGGSIISLVLSGIIINALAQAGVSLLKYIADPLQELPSLEFWLLGGFYSADWKRLLSILPALVLGCAVIIVLRWQVNVLSQGEEEALALGTPVSILRLVLVAAAALLVAAVVSVAGMVGWIGLVAPHIARLLVGNNHKLTLPLSFSAGGSLLLLADTLARTLTRAEIPVSVVTALVGAPFLAYLLWKVGEEPWNR